MNENSIEKQKQVLYSLTVPCSFESIDALDTLCETFISDHPSIPARIGESLRQAVNHGCRRAIERTIAEDTNGSIKVCSLSFLSDSDKRPENLTVQIIDPGNGFAVNRYLPPYDHSLIGQCFFLHRILNSTLRARIRTPHCVEISCQGFEDNGAFGQSTPLPFKSTFPKEEAFHLLAICQCWNKVEFHYRQNVGTILVMEQPILC